MEVARANRRWRCQFRYRGSRRESAVVQLFTLGIARHAQFMTPYKNISGNSGITHYDIGKGYIRVKFKDGSIQRYDSAEDGPEIIATMTRLAIAGEGLSKFIAHNKSGLHPDRQD